ncbi:DUF805 domain-containing protein [Sphingomonas sp. CROZ-RG-20F-R02-07]|uniref:DUF805 domain-containing protein n=1 Tax=Sphingomonas sp. CROZ-RG-20F-R02-07 TaxID=2914832 RepID=UPI001F595733|nr:DUF805 domain-containing protein [Sphingomonas sp. CROZ-RG-20F-R02-07]
MFRTLTHIFDYSSRSTRREYWSFFVGLAILIIIAGAWVANYQKTHFGLSPQFSDDDAAGWGFALFIFVALPGLSLKVRRFHDFGWSGWSVLWIFVPVANIVFELMLLFRGSAGTTAIDSRAEPSQITIYNTPSAGVTDASRAATSHVDEITRLADLHSRGMLTSTEFAAAKAQVLRR